jgi:hypothetical protein
MNHHHWEEIRKKDPKFGTKRNQGQFDIEFDTKLRQAYDDGTFDPFNNSYHLFLMLVYNFGHVWGFCGYQEIMKLKMCDVVVVTYSHDDLDISDEYQGLDYVTVKCPLISPSN